jgi:hypothetical protein
MPSSSAESSSASSGADDAGKSAKKLPLRSTAGVLDATLLAMIAVVLVVYTMAFKLDGYIDVSQHAESKPYGDFDSFYPFYLTQHMDWSCRLLHVMGTTLVIILGFIDPRIIFSTGMSLLVGSAVCHVTRSFSNGITEMLIMTITQQMFMIKLTGSYTKGLPVPIIGYSFAWVGHFVYEKNRPATFIYPAYSLMGDLRLWYDAVTSRSLAF